MNIQKPVFTSTAKKPASRLPMLVSGFKRPINYDDIQSSVSKFRRTTPLSLLKRPQPSLRQDDVVPGTAVEISDQFRTPMPVKTIDTGTGDVLPSRIPTVRKPLEKSPETMSSIEPPRISMDSRATSPMVDWNTITKETELISYKVKINRLQKEIDELNCKNSRLRIDREVSESRLQREIEDGQNKIKELQRQIDLLKREEEKRKNEFEEFQKIHFEQSSYVDKQKVEFEKAIAAMKEELTQIRDENGQIRSKASMDALAYQHQIKQLQSENELLKNENQICIANAELVESKDQEIQSLRRQLQQANTTIEELQNELKSYQEGKKLEAILQGEMSQFRALKEENRHLKNRIDLLTRVDEENVILKEKLLGYENTVELLNQQLNKKNVDIHELQTAREKLNRWNRLFGNDSAESVADNIKQLREKISLLNVQNEILQSEIKMLKESVVNAGHESRSLQADLDNARNKIKQLEDALGQANRKCLFLGKESELYKTMVSSLESSAGKEEQTSARFQELESVIQQYKQAVARLEAELKAVNEQLERKQCHEHENETLRNEIQRIKELNPHIFTNVSLDASTLQTNEKHFRVVHLKENLLEMEITKYNEEFNRLEKENQRLKCMVETLGKGETNQADITKHIDQALEYRFQVEALKEKLAKKEKSFQDLKTVFKKATDTYRAACRDLTGFQIDNVVRNRYRVRSKFANNNEFMVEIDGRTIRLLENATTNNLHDKIDRYLKNSGNYPAFFASYTLDLLADNDTKSDTLFDFSRA